MARGGLLVFLGLVVWGISWFVSPHKAAEAAVAMEDTMRQVGTELGKSLGAPPPTSSGSSSMSPGPHGWRAFRLSWDILTGEAKPAEGRVQKPHERILLGLSGLTNVLMLLGALFLFRGTDGGAARALGVALLVAVAIDLSWLYLNDGEFRSGIQAGYWMWVAGFGLASFGFLARSRDTAV